MKGHLMELQTDFIIVVRHNNRGQYRVKVYMKRNDAYVNAHCKLVPQIVRSSSDMKVLPSWSVIYYVTKYVSKASSDPALDLKIANKVIGKLMEQRIPTSRSLIRSLMIYMVQSSVVSHQEAAYMLMGLPLKMCEGYEFVHVNLKGIRVMDPREQVVKMSLLDKYAMRDTDMMERFEPLPKNLNLFNFLRKYKIERKSLITGDSKRKGSCIVARHLKSGGTTTEDNTNGGSTQTNHKSIGNVGSRNKVVVVPYPLKGPNPKNQVKHAEFCECILTLFKP